VSADGHRLHDGVRRGSRRAAVTLHRSPARLFHSRPAHLVADRAFPSLALLRTLRRVRWGWTLRLGARSAVRVGEEALLVRALLERGAPQCWTVWTAASYGWGGAPGGVHAGGGPRLADAAGVPAHRGQSAPPRPAAQ
jgi:hypothetical protein